MERRTWRTNVSKGKTEELETEKWVLFRFRINCNKNYEKISHNNSCNISLL